MKPVTALLKLLLTLVPLALAGALALVFLGEPLDDIEGRESGGGGANGDLLERAEAAIDAGLAFQATEAEINRHIQAVLEAREADGFELFSTFEGLWVRLGEGGFDLIFERDFLGLDSTVAARIVIETSDSGHRIDAQGGRFGRLPVPRGALSLIRDGLESAGKVFLPEKDVLSRSGELTIAPRQLRLEPIAKPAR